MATPSGSVAGVTMALIYVCIVLLICVSSRRGRTKEENWGVRPGNDFLSRPLRSRLEPITQSFMHDVIPMTSPQD